MPPLNPRGVQSITNANRKYSGIRTLEVLCVPSIRLVRDSWSALSLSLRHPSSACGNRLAKARWPKFKLSHYPLRDGLRQTAHSADGVSLPNNQAQSRWDLLNSGLPERG